MDQRVVVAIDVGTTGIRAIAVNRAVEIVAQAYQSFPQHTPRPGWVEHDPQDILATTRTVLREVAAQVGAAHIVSIGITNQRETTIVWDAATGMPIYNAIVWQCRRTEGMCAELASHAKTVKQKTGLFLDPYFSATKIRWILEHVRGAYEKARHGRLKFGTVDTWLVWHLTGGKVHATEPSNASRTMLFDIAVGGFDDDLLAIFDVPRDLLPEVRASDASFGVLDPEILGREIPICGILGDQQASLFAHGGWQTGVVKNTYGTGLFVMAGTGERMAHAPSLVTTVAWQRGGRTSYALEGSVFMGGATLQWLRDNLGIIASVEESAALAASLEENEGVYFVPALQGLGAPHWRSDARGTIVGLTRRSTKAHLVRAALEAMAYQTRDVIEEMRAHLPSVVAALRVDGGACRNDVLMQFQSDILAIPLERPAITESTALGVAGLSGIAQGFWTADEFIARAATTERVFTPSMAEKERAQLYKGWREALTRAL